MSTVFLDDEHLSDIADSIRSKLGSSDAYLPGEMASAIDSIVAKIGKVDTGTLNVSSTVSSSTNVDITTSTALGYVPKYFFLIKKTPTLTDNSVHIAYFVTLGTYYRGAYAKKGTGATSYTNYSTGSSSSNWNNQSSGGQLGYNTTSHKIYIRAGSSTVIEAGQFVWVAAG